MKKHFLAVVALLGAAVTAECNPGNIVWKKAFTDANDWAVGFDPGGNSAITSDGNAAFLFVNSASNMAAFVPDPGMAGMMAFDPNKKGDYSMILEVSGISGSSSYDVAIDEFTSDHKYLNTVWGIFPRSGSTTRTGVITVNLGDYVFDSATKFVLPKVTVHTGNGKQRVIVKSLQFDCSSAAD